MEDQAGVSSAVREKLDAPPPEQFRNEFERQGILWEGLRRLCETGPWLYCALWQFRFEGGSAGFPNGAARENGGSQGAYETLACTLFYGNQPGEQLRQKVDFEALSVAMAQLCKLEFRKGEGVVGEAADSIDGVRWLSASPSGYRVRPALNIGSSDKGDEQWRAQFAAGLETVLLTAFRGGLLQLGSTEKLPEDPALAASILNAFSSYLVSSRASGSSTADITPPYSPPSQVLKPSFVRIPPLMSLTRPENHPQTHGGHPPRNFEFRSKAQGGPRRNSHRNPFAPSKHSSVLVANTSAAPMFFSSTPNLLAVTRSPDSWRQASAFSPPFSNRRPEICESAQLETTPFSMFGEKVGPSAAVASSRQLIDQLTANREGLFRVPKSKGVAPQWSENGFGSIDLNASHTGLEKEDQQMTESLQCEKDCSTEHGETSLSEEELNTSRGLLGELERIRETTKGKFSASTESEEEPRNGELTTRERLELRKLHQESDSVRSVKRAKGASLLPTSEYAGGLFERSYLRGGQGYLELRNPASNHHDDDISQDDVIDDELMQRLKREAAAQNVQFTWGPDQPLGSNRTAQKRQLAPSDGSEELINKSLAELALLRRYRVEQDGGLQGPFHSRNQPSPLVMDPISETEPVALRPWEKGRQIWYTNLGTLKSLVPESAHLKLEDLLDGAGKRILDLRLQIASRPKKSSSDASSRSYTGLDWRASEKEHLFVEELEDGRLMLVEAYLKFESLLPQVWEALKGEGREIRFTFVEAQGRAVRARFILKLTGASVSETLLNLTI